MGFLHEDGTLDTYHGSYFGDLTWFINSRNPPSKLEWVGPLEPQCPYSNDTEVCKKFLGKEQDIPEGYKIMSQQDVRDNWSACTSAMGAWDISNRWKEQVNFSACSFIRVASMNSVP